MRTNTTVTPGQLWQASDPRRLRLVKVAAAVQGQPQCYRVIVLYPAADTLREPKVQIMHLGQFLQTGPKGYMRVR
jgi:hypothetical protein